METADINTFQNLNDFYEFVEKVDAFKVSTISHKLKELLDADEDTTVKEVIDFEMQAFHFILKDGFARGYIQTPAADGKTIFEYPSAKTLSDDATQYYLKRANETANNSLRIRYLQILLSSGNKQLASVCITPLIDAYFQELDSYFKLSAYQKINSHQWRSVLKNLLPLLLKAKHRVQDWTVVVNRLFFSPGIVPIEAKYRLAEIIIDNRRLFHKDDLLKIYMDLVSMSGQKPYVEDCSAIEQLAAVAIRFAKFLSIDHKVWHDKNGYAYIAQMEKRQSDTSNMIPMHFCEKAIAEFQLAGNKTKVEELHLVYAELRKKFKLDEFPIELDQEDLMEWYGHLDEKAKYLVGKNHPEAILNYLSNGNDIFPDITWLKQYAEKRKSFMDAVTLSKIDINKNSSKKIVTEKEQDWHKIFEQYNYYLEFSVLPLLRRIFYYGFIKQKISFQTIIDFLSKHTWIGCTLASTDSGGKEIKYNWLSVIAPSLHYFHSGLDALFFSKANHINLVICTDSLAMKFEGLIRDFARLIGAHTTIMSKGNMREMYIDELLDLDKMKEYFDENDMLLFRYLFTSKNGLNLRNNIAHSFFHFNHYRVEHMVLMIMALLRLGKYQVDTSKQTM